MYKEQSVDYVMTMFKAYHQFFLEAIAHPHEFRVWASKRSNVQKALSQFTELFGKSEEFSQIFPNEENYRAAIQFLNNDPALLREFEAELNKGVKFFHGANTKLEEILISKLESIDRKTFPRKPGIDQHQYLSDHAQKFAYLMNYEEALSDELLEEFKSLNLFIRNAITFSKPLRDLLQNITGENYPIESSDKIKYIKNHWKRIYGFFSSHSTSTRPDLRHEFESAFLKLSSVRPSEELILKLEDITEIGCPDKSLQQCKYLLKYSQKVYEKVTTEQNLRREFARVTLSQIHLPNDFIEQLNLISVEKYPIDGTNYEKYQYLVKSHKQGHLKEAAYKLLEQFLTSDHSFASDLDTLLMSPAFQNAIMLWYKNKALHSGAKLFSEKTNEVYNNIQTNLRFLLEEEEKQSISEKNREIINLTVDFEASPLEFQDKVNAILNEEKNISSNNSYRDLFKELITSKFKDANKKLPKEFTFKLYQAEEKLSQEEFKKKVSDLIELHFSHSPEYDLAKEAENSAVFESKPKVINFDDPIFADVEEEPSIPAREETIEQDFDGLPLVNLVDSLPAIAIQELTHVDVKEQEKNSDTSSKEDDHIYDEVPAVEEDLQAFEELEDNESGSSPQEDEAEKEKKRKKAREYLISKKPRSFNYDKNRENFNDDKQKEINPEDEEAIKGFLDYVNVILEIKNTPQPEPSLSQLSKHMVSTIFDESHKFEKMKREKGSSDANGILIQLYNDIVDNKGFTGTAFDDALEFSVIKASKDLFLNKDKMSKKVFVQMTKILNDYSQEMIRIKKPAPVVNVNESSLRDDLLAQLRKVRNIDIENSLRLFVLKKSIKRTDYNSITDMDMLKQEIADFNSSLRNQVTFFGPKTSELKKSLLNSIALIENEIHKLEKVELRKLLDLMEHFHIPKNEDGSIDMDRVSSIDLQRIKDRVTQFKSSLAHIGFNAETSQFKTGLKNFIKDIEDRIEDAEADEFEKVLDLMERIKRTDLSSSDLKYDIKEFKSHLGKIGFFNPKACELKKGLRSFINGIEDEVSAFKQKEMTRNLPKYEESKEEQQGERLMSFEM